MHHDKSTRFKGEVKEKSSNCSKNEILSIDSIFSPLSIKQQIITIFKTIFRKNTIVPLNFNEVNRTLLNYLINFENAYY